MKIRASDLELIHADIMAASAIRGCDTRSNPYLNNMMAFHSEQAFEKLLRALLQEQDREEVRKEFESYTKARLAKTDPELAKEFTMTSEDVESAFRGHNVSMMFDACKKFVPDFCKDTPFFEANKRKFPYINELRHGESSISYHHACGLEYNVRHLYSQIKAEYSKETGQDFRDIRNAATVSYSELDYIRFHKKPIEPTESVSEKDASEIKTVLPEDLMLIKAELDAASIILNTSENVRGNLYMANMIALHAGQAIEKSMKAILKSAGESPDKLRCHNITLMFNQVAAIRPNFAENHEFIDANQRRLPYLNNLVRYGERGISYYDAKGLFFVASNLYKEIEAETMEKTGLSRKEIEEAAIAHYRSLQKQYVERPDMPQQNNHKDITD